MPSLTRLGLISVALCACSAPVGPVDSGLIDRIIDEPDSGAVDSGCLDLPTPNRGNGPCKCHSDCANGALCGIESELGFPHGACQSICNVTADCGPGEMCKVITVGRCMTTCTATSQCEAGRYCFKASSDPTGRCVPYCQHDTDCFSGRCDHNTGRCVSQTFVPVGKANSEPCLRDDECLSTICVGVCAAVCSRSAQGCPPTEFCLGGGAQIDTGQCLPRCTQTSECKDPTATCANYTDLGVTARVCF